MKRIHLERLSQPHPEAKAAHILLNAPNHPHVVEYYDMFITEGMLHLVMEDCPDGDLFQFLQRQPNQRVPESEALKILYEITLGLDFLHHNGIAHRDVSLENVLLHDGLAKLCDFGLSCEANASRTDAVGKGYFMAPAVVAMEAPYDSVVADIWSLGIVFFMLLTGSPLVKLASVESPEFRVARQIGCCEVLRCWEIDTMVSRDTQELLDGMLQADPANRLQSTFEILQHLSLFQCGEEVST